MLPGSVEAPAQDDRRSSAPARPGRAGRGASRYTRSPYWDSVLGPPHGRWAAPLWRQHSDAVNREWLASQLAGQSVERLLKTDAFDEAVAAGLYPLLASVARVVIGADLSMRTVGLAVARYSRLRAAAADTRSLPFADATFDVVASVSTLDHFESKVEIEASLSELHRVLHPEGRLLLTLDNARNPVVALRNALPFRLLRALGIVPYYVGATCGPDELQRLVRAAGFEIETVGGLLHCPRVLAVAIARLLDRWGSAVARQDYLHLLMAFERLASRRSRFLTGHYVAIAARKRDGDERAPPAAGERLAS